ncbi:four helix bundle protein [Patescibacteria group bacterium]|nr:four helix bundle protein [Patescibacteria group bacterium]MBU4115578.1 four helix bundle protein [Patescibacteria group bacterium]
MEKKYLKLNDIDAYKISFNLSNVIWKNVLCWNNLAKDTVGKQWIRSADSISANIAEGFGRYTKKDKVSFYRYSYGSIKESLDWNEKARKRGLLTDGEYETIFNELQKLPKLVNQLIKYTNEKLEK